METMGKKVIDKIDDAIANPNIPKIYSNSFICALGSGDLALMLKNGKETVALINLSYTIAKTLSIKLNGLISHLEAKSGNKIMSTDDINEALKQDENSVNSGAK